MPNHCTNHIYITGPQDVLDEISRSHTSDEDNILDFNSIVPMPVNMNITSSSQTAVFAKFLYGDITPEEFIGGASTVKEVALGALLKDKPDMVAQVSDLQDMGSLMTALESGAKYNNNLSVHGHADWYSWSIAYWGTKWNSYNGTRTEYPGSLDFEFDTAWGPPAQVIQELAELYPEVNITHHSIDEGGGFAGTTIYEKGCIVEDIEPAEFSEFAATEFGWEFDVEGDEDEED